MEEVNKNASKESHDFGDLPDLALLNIFQYLPTAADIVNAGRVCSHWHAVSKQKVLWKHVTINLLDLEHHKIYNFFLSIPPCVTYLKIVNCSRNKLSSLFDSKSLIILREKFENLETLIIEKFMLLSYLPKKDFEIDHIPSSVRIISFRGSAISPAFFFRNSKLYRSRNITVIDLSFCSNINGYAISFFNEMTNLKELYLTGCLLDDNDGIMKLFPRHGAKQIQMNLKVLDLEETKVGDWSISRLHPHVPYLEKLYLSKTYVTFYWLKDLGKENTSDEINPTEFPFLTELCLKNTPVQYKALLTLGKFRSMKYIDVVPNDDVKENISNLNENLKRKFRIYDKMELDNTCNHFTKKYRK